MIVRDLRKLLKRCPQDATVAISDRMESDLGAVTSVRQVKTDHYYSDTKHTDIDLGSTRVVLSTNNTYFR